MVGVFICTRCLLLVIIYLLFVIIYLLLVIVYFIICYYLLIVYFIIYLLLAILKYCGFLSRVSHTKPTRQLHFNTVGILQMV